MLRRIGSITRFATPAMGPLVSTTTWLPSEGRMARIGTAAPCRCSCPRPKHPHRWPVARLSVVGPQPQEVGTPLSSMGNRAPVPGQSWTPARLESSRWHPPPPIDPPPGTPSSARAAWHTSVYSFQRCTGPCQARRLPGALPQAPRDSFGRDRKSKRPRPNASPTNGRPSSFRSR